MLVDPEAVSAILQDTAETEIMPRFQRLERHQIREKKPGDLVTDADEAAERRLTQRLRDLLPGSLVVGEEACAADPAVLDRLLGKETVWIIDPIDGTRNFATGRPVFALMVALVQGGRTVAGWIQDPVRKVTAIAQAGEGAWLDGKRLAVCAAAELGRMNGSIGYRRNKLLEGKVGRLVKNGSAAHDYLQLAQGQIHFAYYRRLNPWDHAAGVLMHTEAGGFSALLDGNPYRPQPSPIGMLLAPDQASWDELQPLVDDR